MLGTGLGTLYIVYILSHLIAEDFAFSDKGMEAQRG